MKLDLGLLILRIGIGGSMVFFHGWGKISNPGNWEKLGGSMSQFGITFMPAFWGFMAAFSEFGAAILIMLGLYFRTASVLLAFTMLTAALVHLNMDPASPNAGLKGASHALEFMVVFVALFFTGPGKHALVLRRPGND